MGIARTVTWQYLPSVFVTCRFSTINGLLIPGGGATLEPGHKFYDTAEYLTHLAIEANDKGDYFPVCNSQSGPRACADLSVATTFQSKLVDHIRDYSFCIFCWSSDVSNYQGIAKGSQP